MTALVVVDMQRGVLAGLPFSAGLLSRVRALIDRAPAAGVQVVQLQDDDSLGTPGWELALPGGTVVPKTTDDGFAGTSLDSVLSGVRRIVLAGVLSEMCVSATARSAPARGYSVVIPHDEHGTHDLDDIPAVVVSRVAEHALGDEPAFVPATADVVF